MISPGHLLTILLVPSALAGPLFPRQDNNTTEVSSTPVESSTPVSSESSASPSDSSSPVSSEPASTPESSATESSAAGGDQGSSIAGGGAGGGGGAESTPAAEPTPTEGGGNGADATAAVNALREAGLNSFADLVDGNDQYKQLLSQGGHKTIFAPTDSAVEAIPDLTSNSSLLNQILQYHTVEGDLSADQVPALPEHKLGWTLLEGGPSNLLNGAQPLVTGKTNESHVTVQQPNVVSNVLFTHTGPDLTIYPLDHALTVPQNLSWTAQVLNVTAFPPLVDEGLQGLESTAPVTYFIPTDAGVEASQEQLGQYDAEQRKIVVANHVITGQAVYSTNFTNQNATSVAGQTFQINTEGNTTTVTSGNSSANIIQSDYILATGVVHLIDNVLLNTEGQVQSTNSSGGANGGDQGGVAGGTGDSETPGPTQSGEPATSSGADTATSSGADTATSSGADTATSSGTDTATSSDTDTATSSDTDTATSSAAPETSETTSA